MSLEKWQGILTVQREDTLRQGGGAEVRVAEVSWLQGHEHDVAEEVTGRLANTVASWRMAHISPGTWTTKGCLDTEAEISKY